MSRLPSGYTQLEYIQSSGAQYINTGFNPASTSRAVVDFEFLQNGTVSPFMCRNSSLSGEMFGVFNISGRLRSDYGTTKVSFPTSLSPLQRLIYDRNKNTCTVGDQSVTNTAASFSSARPLFLFASNDNSTAAYFATGKLYSCQLYNDGTLVRNFIPCKNANEEIGLYDTVYSVFYANAGSGSFTAGPEIIPNPPATPTGFQTALAIALRWTAADRADLYNIYRDGTKLGSTPTTQYIDLTAEENQTYTYSVTAENEDGESAAASLTVYTKTGYFQYKPVIESANFQ